MSASSPTLDEALARHAAGDLAGAEAAYLALLEQSPGDVDATHLLAVVAHAKGELALAEQRFLAALAVRPGNVVALCNYGALLRDLGRPAEALGHLDAAVRLGPGHALSWDNRGVVLQDLGRFDEAVACHEHAAQLLPRSARPLFNLGNAFAGLDDDQQALACHRRALALEPGQADVLNNLGGTLLRLGDAEAAAAALHDALALDPRRAAAWLNLGQALLRLHRPRQAIDCCGHADRCGPPTADADLCRGEAWLTLGQPAEALACLDRALALRPADLAGLRQRANALYALGRYDDAAAGHAAVLELVPDAAFVLGDLFHARAGAADWSGRALLIQRLQEGVERGLPVVAPFIARGLPWPPALQLACARIFARHVATAAAAPLPWRDEPPGARLRIGYFSSAFRDHPTAMHIAGLFEAHDRSAFEIFAIALDSASDSAVRRRIVAGVDRFIELDAESDAAVAATARSLGIDIAIDLDGTIHGARPAVFAQRVAPLQIGFLGDPGTSGCDWIDYLIADCIVIAEEELDDYSEKIVFMPHSYQVNDDRREIAAAPTRADAGLPADAFVYCCFNHVRKITPEVFAAWMAVLRQVEGSVMWLPGSGHAADRLRRAAEGSGVAASRLHFAAYLPVAEHRARCQLADLFLDTFDYTGHATSSDALSAGLPVLTRFGGSFAARVSASLLHALALPELVTRSTAEFVARAVAFGRDREALAALRRRLSAARTEAPLFDTRRYARQIEAAFGAMAERRRHGLPPEHLHVDPL